MGKSEVTQGEYLEVMGINPSWFNGVPCEECPDYGTDLTRPVETVSWEDATEYCAKLTERERATGRIAPNSIYRLPTEAEWEYACRTWTSTRFSYGDDPGYTNLTNYAWYFTTATGRHIRWVRNYRTRGDCMTCTATCMNGARTGGPTTCPAGLPSTLRGLTPAGPRDSRRRPGAACRLALPRLPPGPRTATSTSGPTSVSGLCWPAHRP